MFIHVFFMFPETAGKTLEEVEDIFLDSSPGSLKYIGTPAWKTHVDHSILKQERGELSEDEKFGRRSEATTAHVETNSYGDGVPGERVPTTTTKETSAV